MSNKCTTGNCNNPIAADNLCKKHFNEGWDTRHRPDIEAEKIKKPIKRPSTCHPDREDVCQGLCGGCYTKIRKKAIKAGTWKGRFVNE